MAVLDNSEYMTLQEAVALMGPDGNELAVSEGLSARNSLIATMPVMEANGISYHKTGRRIRGGEKPLQERNINQGTTGWASAHDSVKEPMGDFEEVVQIDEKWLNDAPNAASRRAREIRYHLENFSQQSETAMIYNKPNGTNPIKGINVRYNDLSLDNVHNVGGTSANSVTSMLIAEWNPDFASYIYPKGSMAGISEMDEGKHPVKDANSGTYFAWFNKIGMKFGLNIVEDERIQRVCNIELNSPGSMGNKDIVDAASMQHVMWAISKLPSADGSIYNSQAYMYVNRAVKAQLDIWADKNAFNTRMYTDPVLKRPVVEVGGVRVLVCTSILNTEAVVA